MSPVNRSKIMYVVGELTYGGYQSQLLLLLSKLSVDYQVIVFVWNYSDEHPLLKDFKSLPVHVCGKKSTTFFKKICALFKTIKDEKPEYIHSYSFYTNYVAWLGYKLTSVKGVLGSFRSNFKPHYWKNKGIVPYTKFVLSASLPRLAIANSKNCKQEIVRYKGLFKPSDVYVVPNGVDTDRFKPGTKQEPAGGIKILLIGRLSPEKRIESVIQMIKKCRNGQHPFFTVHIFGDGPSRASIELLVEELKLQDCVFFHGFHKSPELVYPFYDIYILNSEFEGTPNAVIESMSAGLAVIATQVGDVGDIIEHHTSGFLVEWDDDASLFKYFMRLLEEPELRKEIGRNARIRICETRSVDTFYRQTLNVYRTIGWKV